MGEFTCKNCGKKISIPDSHTANRGTCPNCKTQLDTTGTRSVYNLTLLDIPPQLQEDREDTSQTNSTEGLTTKETDAARKRKYPWLIDIFLYPSNRSGLVILGAIIAIRWFMKIVARSIGLTPALSPMVIIVVPLLCIFIVVRVLLFLFFFWYLCECVRDSAEGGTRAPETIGKTPGLGEMLWLLRSLLCFVIFGGPAVGYYLSVQQTDALFWGLFVLGVLLSPMSFLAFVMFDSLTSGINPVLLVGSICSTFLPYCAMVLIFLTAGLFIINTVQGVNFTLFQQFIIYCAVMYLSTVTAHVLGWFYHRYQERLNWEV